MGTSSRSFTLQEWRERLLLRTLRLGCLVLVIPWLGGTWASLDAGLFLLATLTTVAFVALLGVAYLPGLSYEARALGMLGICLVVGLAVILQVGPMGAGAIWLGAVPVLASLLFGVRGAAWGLAVLLVSVSLLSIPVLTGAGLGPPDGFGPGVRYDLPSWLATAASMLGLAAFLALPFAMLLERAERARAREVEARQALEAEIEQREQLEARLRQSHKMEALGTFAGGIAHDFNNLLVPILGEAEELEDHLPRHSPAWDASRRIRGAAHMAGELVRGILAFSRGEPGASVMVDPEPLVLEIADLLRPGLPEHVEVVTRCHADGRRVRADPVQLHQVIMNLAVNGLHAMEATGGTLAMEVGPAPAPEAAGVDSHGAEDRADSGGWVEILVRDDGVGMDESTLRQAMDPFFTTRPTGKGSGLGLSTSHGIVEALGGRLTLTSTAGQGTTARVLLPPGRGLELELEPGVGPDSRAGEALAPTGSAESLAPAPEPGSEGGARAGIRILLVDDDEHVRSTLRRVLERMGHAVTDASSGGRALELLDQGLAFDLLLTDHTMPEMTGAELVAALASRGSALPTLLLSGHVDQARTATLQALSSGAVDPEAVLRITRFLGKPVGRNELQRAILDAQAEGEPRIA